MSPSAHGTGSIAKDRVKRLQMVVVGEVGCKIMSSVHQGNYTQEFTEAMASCLRPTQDQAHQKSAQLGSFGS